MVLGIYGAGGTGMAIHDYLTRDHQNMRRFDKLLFVDDICTEKIFHGLNVLSFEKVKDSFKKDEIQFVIGLGDPNQREVLFNKIKEHGFELAKIIFSPTEIAPTAKIGEGCCIGKNCFIDNNVVIGRNIIVFPQTYIGHDTVVKDHSILSVRAFVGGHSVLDEKVYYGPCAVCKDKIHIGEGAIVGPGAAVYKEVPPYRTAIGNPARMIPRASDQVFN